MGFVGFILAGAASHWISGKCRGRNAQKAFRFAAWGFWLLILTLIDLSFLLPFGFGFLNWWIIKIIPSVLLFLAAGNSMLKEMRAQQRGDYTEKAI